MILPSVVAIEKAKERGNPFIGKLMIAAQLLMFLSVIPAFIFGAKTGSYMGYVLPLLFLTVYVACGLYLFVLPRRERNK